MYQTSAEGTELLLTGWWRGNVCVFLRTVLWLIMKIYTSTLC